MHCTQCSASMSRSDKFCAACGHPARRAPRSAQPRPVFSNADGAAQHLALQADKARRARKRCGVAFLVYLVAGAAWIVNQAAGHDLRAANLFALVGMTYAIGLVPLFIIGAFLAGTAVSSDEYYAVTGSRNGEGEHQCVHCGHRGIYVRGEYRTNYRHHNCSRCKQYLYTTAG